MTNNYKTKKLKMLRRFGNEYVICVSTCYLFSENILVMKMVSEGAGEVLTLMNLWHVSVIACLWKQNLSFEFSRR